MQTFLRN